MHNRILQSQLQQLEADHEVLEKKFQQQMKEKSELEKKYEERLEIARQRGMIPSGVMIGRINAQRQLLAKKEDQLAEVVASAQLDPEV
ncbi:MAG: hypothetical protein EZS28_040148 [Streblomastix strix]|uniref:Growth arrest-specific protein 8 domain-containing protein n=1 Tax=Streblomastix strix TaxID=222440 RepID=A0A5J4U0U0_9EUKA|nr:MAG: hypothetical protein EZS28_040148 [Streblomastix strix]